MNTSKLMLTSINAVAIALVAAATVVFAHSLPTEATALPVFTSLAQFQQQSGAHSVGAIPTIVGSDRNSRQVQATTIGDMHIRVAAPGVGLALGRDTYDSPGVWIPSLPVNVVAVHAVENLDISFPYAVNAFGFEIYEPSDSHVARAATVDTTFQVNLSHGSTPVGTFTYNAPDNTRAFVGTISTVAFDRVEIRDLPGTIDNEYFVSFWAKRAPAPTAAPTPTPTATPLPQCQDGVDNDHDGFVDMADPGCSSRQDNDEFHVIVTPTPAPKQCQDGIDNDSDGAVDMNDFSCSSPTDNDETNPKAACQDGLDNDHDGLVDMADPGCSSKQDNDEFHVIVTPTPTPTPTSAPKAQCQDGIDNDNDGKTDYPADPGCVSKQDNDEFHVIATPTPTLTPTATPTATPPPTETPTATPTPTPDEGDADFTITKTDNRDITRPGHSLTYTITLKNTGDREIHDLKVMDTVPSHLSITKVTPGASTTSGQTVIWEGITLNEGDTKEFKITATVKSSTPHGTILHNTARVVSDDFGIKEASSDKTTVLKETVTVVSGPAIAGAVQVPITAKTGSSLIGALASLLGSGGLMMVIRRGL